jgi:PKD repeat protein
VILVADSATANADFVAPICFPTPGPVDVPFTNLSTGDSIRYKWTVNPAAGTSFVNGTSDTSTNPVIRFTSGGKYDVTLVVLNACNRPVWTGEVNLRYVPVIDTNSIPPGCFPPYSFNPYTANYFTFDNGGDDAATYNWIFSGGAPANSTQQDPGNVTFNAAGTFQVKATITNICGLDSITQNVTVLNNIVPNAGPDLNVCTSSPAQNLNALPAGGVWRGNGITDSVAGTFNPNGLPAGKDTIVYVLNPLSNCPTYDTLIITISEIIGLTAGPPQTICKQSGLLALVNNPAFPGGTWFGGGVVQANPGLFDPAGVTPGVYQVGYSYTDPTGSCTDTAFKDITVFDSVRVNYNIPPLCAGQAYDFGSSTGNIQSAIWDFGDGSPLVNLVSPSHTYNNPGNYTVRIYAQTPDGCRDTILIPVVVSSIPPLSFTVAPQVSCDGQNIVFDFPPAHVPANKYTWDFGVQQVITLTPDQQVINFPKPILRDSNFNVLLTAEYDCGPISYFDTVKVKASPKARFGTSQNGCSPFTPSIFNLSYGSPDTYTWDFGNGQTGTGFNPTPPTYINNSRNDTTYKIKLTATNTCGTDTITNSITVLGNQVTANVIASTTQGCQPLEVQFSSFVNPPEATVFWDFGDGGTSFSENPIYTYNGFGVFNAKMIATTGCGKDSVTTTITVHPKPDADFILPGNLCAGIPATFTNSSTGASSYVWTFSNGIISSLTNHPIKIARTR